MMAAEIIEIDDAEYYADRSAVSRTELDVLRRDPALYEAMYLLGTVPKPDLACFDRGHELEPVLLSPIPVHLRFKKIPPQVLASNGARLGNKWKEFEKANADFVLIKPGEWRMQVFEAVQQHDDAKALLDAPGEYQPAIYWDDETTGVRCRGKLDKLSADRRIITDLKTSESAEPEDFARSAARYGYHRQAAMYQDAVEALGFPRPRFIFLVCETRAPWRVETIELDEKFVELGRRQNRKALELYASCQARGIWRREKFGQTHTVAAPGWALAEEQWEI